MNRLFLIFGFVLLNIFCVANIAYSQKKMNSSTKVLTIKEAKKFHKKQGDILMIHFNDRTDSTFVLDKDVFGIDWSEAKVMTNDKYSSIQLSMAPIKYSALKEERPTKYYVLAEELATKWKYSHPLKTKLLIIKDNNSGKLSQFILYIFSPMSGEEADEFAINDFIHPFYTITVATTKGVPITTYCSGDNLSKYDIEQNYSTNAFAEVKFGTNSKIVYKFFMVQNDDLILPREKINEWICAIMDDLTKQI